MRQLFTLGFSPCPNDAFIFCALVNNLLDCGDVLFEPVIEDVETLNRKALIGALDITKMSLHAFAFAAKNYFILESGSALGKNCGPLLISKKKYSTADVKKLSIAIPGKFTTADLLLNIFFPGAKNKTEMIFSEIENAVLNE